MIVNTQQGMSGSAVLSCARAPSPYGSPSPPLTHTPPACAAPWLTEVQASLLPRLPHVLVGRHVARAHQLQQITPVLHNERV